MAIVRTLITTLGYKVDEAGLNQYEAGFQRIKSMTLGFASAMGLAFGAEKIYEFIDGLLDTGKEINKIRAQITNLARPQDDVNAAMERTLEIANLVGVEYSKVADTFRDFLQNTREGKLSQEQLLQATENVFKALKVDKASSEQTERMFHLIERIDVMGKASPRMIGMLQNVSQTALTILEKYFNTNEDGLRELAKDGKITAEIFMEALARPNAELEERFSKVPYTIGRAFTYARNQITPLIAELLKTTRVSVLLGTTIKWLVDLIVNGIKWFNREVIQIKQLIEILGYALAVTLGPWLIRQLTLATLWTARWAAATLAANWPWILMAASIFAVGVAIQDLVYWIQGKGSLIGSWVGPFDQLSENFKKLDIFAGPRIIQDLIDGKWSDALTDFNVLLGNTSAQILAIGLAVVGVGLAFAGWRFILSPILGALRTTKKVVSEIAEAGADAVGGGAGKGAKPAAKVPGQGELPLVGGGGPSKLGTALRVLGAVTVIGTAIEVAIAGKGWFQSGFDAIRDAVMGPGTSDKMREDAKKKTENANPMWPFWGPKYNEGSPEASDPSKQRLDIFEWWKGISKKTAAPVSEVTKPVEQTPASAIDQTWKGWIQDNFGYLAPGMGKAGEAAFGTTPGALAKPQATTDNRNQSVTVNHSPTNNITVTTDDQSMVASIIQQKLADIGKATSDAIAKQITTSMPRTEAATQ